MARAGFEWNRREVGKFLKDDDGGKKAVQDAARSVLGEVQGANEARIDEYVTDRYVNGIVVDASSQARHGSATRAANAAAAKASKR